MANNTPKVPSRGHKYSILNTFYGLGYWPFSAAIASGFAWLMFWAYVLFFVDYWYYLLISTAVLTAFALVEAYLNKSFVKEDPKQVVFDEFVGMMVIFLICPEIDLWVSVGALVLFRIIDNIKFPPFNFFDKKKGQVWAVYADDIFIGIVLGLIAKLVMMFW